MGDWVIRVNRKEISEMSTQIMDSSLISQESQETLTPGSLCSLGEKRLGYWGKERDGANSQRLRWSAKLTLNIIQIRKSCGEEQRWVEVRCGARFCLVTP